MGCSYTNPINPCYGNTKCTLYTGGNLACSGVLNNDTLTTVISKLDAKICTAILSLVIADTNSINLSGAGTTASPLSADLIISPQGGNSIVVLPDGVYSAGATYIFSNGITETSGAVKLGGALTGNTTITLSTFNFTLAGVNIFLTSFLNNTGTKILSTDSTGRLTLTEASTFLTNAGYPTLHQVLTNGNTSTLGAIIGDLTVTDYFSALSTGLFSDLLLNNDGTKFLQTNGAGKFILSSLTALSNFTAGNLSPIFTTSVANPTTSPSLTFNLTSVTANKFLGGPASGTGAPTYRNIVQADIPQDMTGYIWNQAAVVQTAQFNISGGGSLTQLNVRADGNSTGAGNGGVRLGLVGQAPAGIFTDTDNTKLCFQAGGNVGMRLSSTRRLTLGGNNENAAAAFLTIWNNTDIPAIRLRQESTTTGNYLEMKDNGGSTLAVFNYLGHCGIKATPDGTTFLTLGAGGVVGPNDFIPMKFLPGTNTVTPVVGAVEYNNTFHLTNSDGTRRHIVTALNTTKVTAGAPLTNDGYILVNIGGNNIKVMTTA